MPSTFQTLTKLTSSGNIQTWTIGVIAPSDIVLEFGQKGGKLQRSVEHIAEGKNIGKSNETTPYEQACLEAESRWNKKRDSGYVVEGALGFIPSALPMLAQSYDKHAKKIKFPAYVQVKMDGCRTTTSRIGPTVQLFSRKGKEFKALPHLNKQILALGLDEGIHLDGELYTHGENFQDIISKIKRDDIHPDSETIEYHVYDIFSPASPEKWTYHQRWEKLQKLNLSSTLNIKLVETLEVNNEEELFKYHAECVARGYEGCMIRNKLGLYVCDKRSYDLQKVKTFQTDEFEIVGAEENRGRQAGQCSLLCRTKAGNTFSVKPEGNEEQREMYWRLHLRGELVGKMLTVRYFELSKDGIPRFPIGQVVVGLAIRDYE